MLRTRLALFAALTVGLAASQASAADLPRKAPAYVPPAPPPYVWTGCYLGANVGAAWAHADVDNVTTGGSISRSSDTGFAGGGQIGCDYQMGAWVVGIRNMFDGTSISGSRTFADPRTFAGTGTVDTKVNWFDTLTARGGYLIQPNLLFYVQGGAAWARAQATAFTPAGAVGSVSGNSNTGWTVGGGAEWMFVPHWSVFLEYNYMGFGTRSNAFQVCGLGVCDTFSAKANVSDVLVGVNYRF
ncbi:MAG TPA: outer membrane beta-barrel protein [Pseudolabrys sp.]|nr:outer membrane beta-barrel protein [Pseudolabrys sp.]